MRESTDQRRVLVDQEPLRDPEMSAKAKGLYAVLSSLDGDQVTVAKLTECFTDGEAGIKSGLNELEHRGYLTREVKRDGRGRRAGVRYVIHARRGDEPERHSA